MVKIEDNIMSTAVGFDTATENAVSAHLDNFALSADSTTAQINNIVVYRRNRRSFLGGLFKKIGNLFKTIVTKFVSNVVSKWLSSLLGIKIKVTISVGKVDSSLGAGVQSTERVAPGSVGAFSTE